MVTSDGTHWSFLTAFSQVIAQCVHWSGGIHTMSC